MTQDQHCTCGHPWHTKGRCIHEGCLCLNEYKQPVTDIHKRLCREYYEKLIGPLRAEAREHGYALAVHGSLERDIDLVAIPWRDRVSHPAALSEAIEKIAATVIGTASMHPFEAERRWFQAGCPGSKPHGRLVWSFHLGGGPYIDLSVMPPTPQF